MLEILCSRIPCGERVLALTIGTVWYALGIYLFLGVLICLLHPQLLRKQFGDLKAAQFHSRSTFVKPTIGFVTCMLYTVLWPVAWFNAGKSEKKAKALDAQLDRLRPFFRVTYAGGDGSSFEEAIIIQGATILSGPPAAHEYIERHYPSYEIGEHFLKEQKERKYALLELTSVDGQKKTLYFNISDWRDPFLRAWNVRSSKS